MTWITDNLPHIWDIVSGCVTQLTTNSLFQLFLVAGLIPIGFRIFRSAKRAARR